MRLPLWLARLQANFVSLERIDQRVLYEQYVGTGSDVGDDLSYMGMLGPFGADDEAVAFRDSLKYLVDLEAEYARRGYEPFPLDEFIEYGGYGVAPPIGMRKRASGQEAVLHAADFALEHGLIA